MKTLLSRRSWLRFFRDRRSRLAIAGLTLALAPSIEARADDDPRVVTARTTAAQDFAVCAKTASAEDRQAAIAAHQTAMNFVDHQQFDKAIQSWKNGWSFDCTHPILLENVANAEKSAGDAAMAIALFELYEARVPDASDKADVDKTIAELKDTLAKTPMKNAFHFDPNGAVATPTLPANATPVTPTPVPDEPTTRPFGPAPWIVFGVGAAVLVGGVPLLVIGQSHVSDAKKQCGGTTNCTQTEQDLGNGGSTLTGAGIGMLAGGTAIAIGSLIWQFVGNRPRPTQVDKVNAAAPPRIDLAPIATDKLGGFVVRGAF